MFQMTSKHSLTTTNSENEFANHVRARINILTMTEKQEFQFALNDCTDKFYIEDFSARRRIDPKSNFGMMYAMAEFDGLFLVNETNDGFFPSFVDKYRVDASN